MNKRGKKWFFALGQIDRATGTFNKRASSQAIGCWPWWAKDAYIKAFYL